MLLVHRDAMGYLEAALEFRVVDIKGQLEPSGQFIWVEQLELNPRIDASLHLQRFITEICLHVPQAIWAYWERREKTGRTLHCYSRSQLCKRVRRDADVVAAMGH